MSRTRFRADLPLALISYALAALAGGPSIAGQAPIEIPAPCDPRMPSFEGRAYVGASSADVPLAGEELLASGSCGIAPFDPVEDAEADSSFDLTGGEGDGQLVIEVPDGSLEADAVVANAPQNPDPVTGRPRIAGSSGDCPLPDGPGDDYWPSEACLRPGATRYGELPNDSLNEGLDGPTIPDGAVFSWDPMAPDVIEFPYLAPANNLPIFLENDSLAADPSEIRRRYADPVDPLYQGTRFRAGMPRCGAPEEDKNSCVAPLYVAPLDPLNTPEAVMDPADAYHPESPYSEANASESQPSNRSFFDSLCDWSLAAGLGAAYPGIYQREQISLVQTLLGLSGQACTDYLAGRGYPGEPGTSCQDDVASWLSIFTPMDADAAFSSLIADVEQAGEPCFLTSLGLFDPRELVEPQSLIAQSLAGYPTFALLAPFAASDPPLVELWKDARTVPDGASRERLSEEFAGCFDPRATNIQRSAGRRCDSDDPAAGNPGLPESLRFQTLNAVLAPEQESLLGCGPFRDNNCDNVGWKLFDAHTAALAQSFVHRALESEARPRWRSDGLPAGSAVHVLRSAEELGDDELCLSASGMPDEGCSEIVDEGGTPRLLITNLGSRFYGLTTDQVRLLFAPFIPNCSSWLGRTDPGVDCIERYAQPGTIGARDIGFGTFDESGGFVPGLSHPNFFLEQGSVCPTTAFGGAIDQVLPGCRRKWKNFQDESELVLVMPDDSQVRRPILNLFGDDLGGSESTERLDPRSWDVTRDGDPDFSGFDAGKTIGPTNQARIHPALVFRTQKRPGNANSLGPEERCSYDEYRPADQQDEFELAGDGLPQCSRFRRSELQVPPDQDVYPKGVGHPFTGQPWATEFGALSWNLMALLVLQSSEFAERWIPDPTRPDDFPLAWRAPLAYADFDPNDPDNSERVAEIEMIRDSLPDTPTNRAQIASLRSQMKPICSFITPTRCGKIQEFLSYTARIESGDPEAIPERHWLWEIGGEYAVSEAMGSLAGTQTVHVAGPRIAQAENDSGTDDPSALLGSFAGMVEAGDDFEWPLLLVGTVPEPSATSLGLAALACVLALAQRARRARLEPAGTTPARTRRAPGC